LQGFAENAARLRKQQVMVKIVMTMMRALLLRTRKDVAHFSLTHTNQRHTCALALEMRESFTSLPRMPIAVAALFFADILSSGEERQLVLTATAAPLYAKASPVREMVALLISGSGASQAMMPPAALARCTPAPSEQLQRAQNESLGKMGQATVIKRY
jgi:hypothetical protein